eukprot:gene1778-1981_t
MDGTPTKLRECISPLVSRDYCAVCMKDVHQYKTPKDHIINLFHPNGHKTEFGPILEEHLDVELGDIDFRISCKACCRSVKTAVKNKEEKRASFLRGRETVQLKYLSNKVKRGVPTDTECPPESKRTVHEKPERRRQLVSDASAQTEDKWPFCELGRNLLSHFQDGVVKEEVQVISASGGLTVTKPVPSDLQAVTRCLCSGNCEAIANIIWKLPGCRAELEKIVSRQVAVECAKICSDQQSTFKAVQERSIEQFSFEGQEKELEKNSPLLRKIVVSAGTNKRNLSRNKRKTIDSIKPALLTSIAVILKCRNQYMNMNALCSREDNTSVVKCWAGANDDVGTEEATEKLGVAEADEKDQCNISIANITDQKSNDIQGDHSPENNLLEMQQATQDTKDSEYGWNEWDFIEDSEDILNLSTVLEEFSMDEARSTECLHETADEPSLQVSTTKTVPCFILAGDNVNFAPKSRHTNHLKRNEQINLFNCIATKKRVPYAKDRIDGKVPICTAPAEVPLKVFLPGTDEDASLRAEFKHKIGLTLIKYVKEVKWFEKLLPNNLHHENIPYTKSKSETVCLGVLSKDENVTKDITETMQFLHQFVPKKDGKIQNVLSFGDELTCEREHNAQEDQRDASSTLKRLEDTIVDTFVLPSIAVDWKPEETQWKCEKCNKTYKKIAGLRKHTKEKHGEGQEIVKGYECKYCTKFYVRIVNFRRHILKHHDEAGVAIDEQLLIEEIRDSAVIPDTLPKLNGDHEKEETNEGDYVHMF